MKTRLMMSAAALGATVLAGCQGDVNDRLVLAASVELPTVSPPLDEITEYPARDWSGPGPATTSVSRDSWDRTEVRVPVDGTVHGPTWTNRVQRNDTDVSRRAGVYPTALSALDLRGASDWPIVSGAFESYGRWLVEWALFPVKLFVDPLWSEHQSPRVVYKRWRTDDWTLSP